MSILFGTKYIPTLDGGAHGYNAKIIASLVTDSDSFYAPFFIMNPELVPNWFTGGLLGVLNSFLAPETAEKTVLVIFFLVFPLLFKLVVDAVTQSKSYLVLLVFPFTHFTLIYYGFFNFAYGIVFCLLGIWYWNKNFDRLTIKRLLLFFLICFLAYFSHLFSLITLLLFCGIKEIYEALVAVLIQQNKVKFAQQLKTSLIRGSKLLACSIIPLILTWLYFKKRPSDGLEQFYDLTALNNILIDANIFKSFGSAEDYTARTFFYFFCALTVYAIVSRIIEVIQTKDKTMMFKKQDVFLYCSALMFYFFYTQPNSDGYGAFISVRLALYAFIFLALWLASNKYDPATKTTALLVLIVNLYFFIDVKKDSIKWLNGELKKMDGVADRIKEGSIVVPVNFADYNWLGAHYSNYLGARKKIIVTENFEASTGYFPVLWKNRDLGFDMMRHPANIDECNYFFNKLNNYPGGKINYVFVYGERTDLEFCNKVIEGLKKDFAQVYSYQNVFLFERIQK